MLNGKESKDKSGLMTKPRLFSHKISGWLKKSSTSLSANKKSYLKNKKNIAIGVVLLFALLLTGTLLFSNTHKEDKNNPVVFSIDDRDFYAKDIDPLLGLAEQKYGLNIWDAQKELILAMKYKIAAEKLNLEVTDKQVRESLSKTSYANKISDETDNLDDWALLTGEKLALEDYAKDNIRKDKQGYTFIFYFGNLIIPNNFGNNLTNFGNQKLIERDENYAKQKAEEYHQQLLDGTDPEVVFESARNDKMLNRDYQQGNSSSVKFGDDPEKPWKQEVYFDEVAESIESSTQVNKPSEIKTGKIATIEEPQKDDDYKVAYYYFTYLTYNDGKMQKLQELLNSMVVVKK